MNFTWSRNVEGKTGFIDPASAGYPGTRGRRSRLLAEEQVPLSRLCDLDVRVPA